MADAPGPMSGVRVVEVAGFVFVPIATAILADLGADVIKVEPLGGDLLRRGSATSPDGEPTLDGSGLLVELSNRSKRSVALDLTTDGGRAALHRLVETADVFATSYLEGVRRRLQVDVEHIRAVNPRVIYARGNGWGSAGPQRDAPAFDLVSAWASSGVAALVVDAQGEPPSMPIGIFDTTAGSMLAGAIGMALYQRAATGVAAVVDSALLNVGMWAVQTDISARPRAIETARTVRAAPKNALVNWYRTRDGRWIYFALVRSPAEFDPFCRAIGRSELLDDARFTTPEARGENSIALAEILVDTFAARTLADWIERLQPIDSAWGVMLAPEEVAAHPQTAPNGFLQPHSTLAGAPVDLVAPPMQFDCAPTRPRGPAPAVGQHTAEVLTELGYDQPAIDDLSTRGAIRVR